MTTAVSYGLRWREFAPLPFAPASLLTQGNGGIVVNGLFEAVNGVYAAGSAASFFDPVMGRRRVGSHDHCVNSGLYAGEGMGYLVFVLRKRACVYGGVVIRD